MKQRIIAIVMMFCLLLTLCACTGKKDNTSAEASSASVSSENSEDIPETDSPEDESVESELIAPDGSVSEFKPLEVQESATIEPGENTAIEIH